jgi:imidazolonepropionase-like amidohydrolase
LETLEVTMKAIRAPLLLALAPGLLLAEQPRRGEAKALAFTHVTVIDATGTPAKPDMAVVVIGDRITAVGRTDAVSIPKDADVLDASRKFLIPGLWDMHVHWYGYDRAYLGLFTVNGVTGVRIMWGAPVHFEWRRDIQEGALVGPRMVISGSILDGPRPAWPDSIGVGNGPDGRRAVRKVKSEGADFVKVYSLLPREAYFGIADEAEKRGLPFAGHIPHSVSAGEASDAGQKSVEHLMGILEACSTEEPAWRKGVLDAFSNLPQGQTVASPARTRPLTRMILDSFNPAKAAALFARLRRNHTWQCPTLTYLRSAASMDDPAFRNDARLRYVPRSLGTQWDPTTDYRFRERSAADWDLARVAYQKQVELVGMMHRAGVPLLAGTDVQNPYCFPGFSLHDELALLVKAGLTPTEALQAATRNPARFLGKDREFGTIERGKFADLVLLNANPLDDINNTRKIAAVVANGRLLDRKRLDGMLDQVEAAAKEQ